MRGMSLVDSAEQADVASVGVSQAAATDAAIAEAADAAAAGISAQVGVAGLQRESSDASAVRLSPPSINASRVQIAYPQTNFTSANRVLHGGAQTGPTDAWIVGGGDYLDANGVFNGPTPMRSVSVAANAGATISIAGIGGDLRLAGARISSATIDGVTAVAFWTDPTSNQGVALPNGTTGSPNFTPKPVMVLNPARGSVLTVMPFSGGTLTVNQVAGPAIQDWPMIGASNTPTTYEVPLTSDAAITSFIGVGNMSGGSTGTWAFNREYHVDPGTGLQYFRFSSDPNASPTNTTGAYSRLIEWYIGVPSTTEAYARWAMYIEPDVAVGFNELGLKLPGLGNAGGWGTVVGQTEVISLRCEHSPPGPNNSGLYGLLTYDYSVESGSGFGVIENANALLRQGQWYVIEQHAKLNTPGVSDGIQELYVDGNLVFQRTDVHYRDQSNTTLLNFQFNFYHGGLNAPLSPIHYRIARLGVSSSYMGLPPEFVPAGAPSWTPAVGSIANVSLNAMSDVNPCPANNCSYSGVTKQGSEYNDTGVVYAPKLGAMGSIICTGGGHNDYYGNEVYRYDIATRLFSRITEPHGVVQATSPPLAAGDTNIGNHTDRLYGELWADNTFTTTLQNQPGSSHNYGYQVIVPIGPRGTLITLSRPVLTPNGVCGRMAHSLDLDAQVNGGSATSLWQRAASSLCPSPVPAFGGAVYDALRNRVWGTASTGTNGTMYYLDLVSRTWTMTTTALGGFYGTLMRSEAVDRMVYFRRYVDGYQLKIVNPNTGAITQPTAIGDMPPYDSTNSPLGGGSDWCVDLPGGEGFVYYNGGGGNVVHVCRPGVNFDSDPWTFTAQTLTPVTSGDAPAIQYSPPNCTHLHRFVYVPALRCFLWFASTTAPVNAWRLFS